MRKRIFCAAALAAFLGVPATFADAPVPAPDAEKISSEKSLAESAAETRISRVVVFPQGARVTRSAKVKLRAGTQEILLKGLPEYVSDETLTAETRIAGTRVASVASRFERATETPESLASARAAKEKLDRARSAHVDLAYRCADAEARLSALEEFKPFAAAQDFAYQGKRAGGNTLSAQEKMLPFPLPFNAETALKTLDFLENEAKIALADAMRLKKELADAELDEEIAESEYRQLADAKNARPRERFTLVRIIADADCEGEIDVNYMADDAQWRPSYDVRVDPASKSATLVSYAIISQRSGEDWDDVPVTLSTAYPNASANLPEFHKILVTEKFGSPAPAARGFGGGESAALRKRSPRNAATAFSAPAKQENAARNDVRLLLDNAGTNVIALNDGGNVVGAKDITYRAGNYIFRDSAGALQSVSEKNVRSLSKNYTETAQDDDVALAANRLRDPAKDLRGLDFRRELARAETIKSAGAPRRFLLSSETFSGEFYCQLASPAPETIPPRAYQMLAVKNENFRPILAGPANIFYGADFIGEMDVPCTQRAGTVLIPLGVDPRVSVERQRLRDIETVGTFTSSRRNSVSVSIKIANRTPEPLRIVCDEAVPVSTMQEIEVSEPKFSPAATFAKETGVARWDETLAPAQEIELRANYAIEYPTDFAIEETTR